jgi:response regulator of citrate/malate metabolism
MRKATKQALEQWQTAMAEPHQSDEGYTSRELCELMHLSMNTVLKRLRMAEQQGRLKRGVRYEANVAGRVVPKDVYQLNTPRAPKGRARRAV